MILKHEPRIGHLEESQNRGQDPVPVRSFSGRGMNRTGIPINALWIVIAMLTDKFGAGLV